MNGCKIPEITDLVIGLKIQLLKRPGLENPYQRITISGPTRGTDIMSIKELLGHNSVRTTSRYVHVSKKHISKIQSPLDKLL